MSPTALDDRNLGRRLKGGNCNCYNAELVFVPTYPEIDRSYFQRQDWSTSEFGHLEGKDIIPPNAPPGRGAGFISGPQSKLTTPLILSLEDRGPVSWST